MKKFLQQFLIILLLNVSLNSYSQEKSASENLPIYSYETAIIEGEKYTAFLNKNGLFLLNSRKDTLLKKSESYLSLKFKDFDKDGFKDLFLDLGGNAPETYVLLLYTPATKNFKKVINFETFSDPKLIIGTKYYYSYKKGGCADNTWNSKLFYLKNFTAIEIGHIHGEGCGIKDGIFIYKVRNSDKTLLQTLPLNTIDKYKEYKWGFIKQYWTKRYKQFA